MNPPRGDVASDSDTMVTGNQAPENTGNFFPDFVIES